MATRLIGRRLLITFVTLGEPITEVLGTARCAEYSIDSLDDVPAGWSSTIAPGQGACGDRPDGDFGTENSLSLSGGT
ncbi:hypothetical protein, partial [Frankia sp. AiPs1]